MNLARTRRILERRGLKALFPDELAEVYAANEAALHVLKDTARGFQVDPDSIFDPDMFDHEVRAILDSYGDA